jgi:hypothetical protein
MTWIHVDGPESYPEGTAYAWLLNDTKISDEKDLLYVFAQPGDYELIFKAYDYVKTREHVHSVKIRINDKVYRNGVEKVFEYIPAPGQFINEYPLWKSGNTVEDMRLKAENDLKKKSTVHLGGFGGYIVMGFDHTIVNRSGNDFKVLGNAILSWAEPGIIMVSYDANGNGLPDDEWYEIAGSEYNNPETIKEYAITYYKPDPDKTPVTDPGRPYIIDLNYIRWTDNRGGAGYLSKNTFNRQSYYPEWVTDASITFRGSLLKSNLTSDPSGDGYYTNSAFEYGYADNWTNNDSRQEIDIDWAVDKNGNPVKLKGIDFIKIYTAVQGEGGVSGELSTEVDGFTDLNL